MFSKKIGLIFLLALVAFMFYLFYMKLAENQSSSLKSTLIGQNAPYFQGEDFFTDQGITSHELFNDKHTLINVFASWCISCRREHKYLMKLKREGKLQIVGINYKDTKQDALNFLDRLGNPYHYVVADNGKIGFDYGVYATPESFLVDKNGIIKYKRVGVLNESIINNEILPLID